MLKGMSNRDFLLLVRGLTKETQNWEDIALESTERMGTLEIAENLEIMKTLRRHAKGSLGITLFEAIKEKTMNLTN